MGKTVMTLVIPDPKVRKPQPKAAQKHKDKTKYTRKVKHKAPDWGPCHAEVVIFSLSGAAPEHNVFEAFPRLSTAISPTGGDDGHGPFVREISAHGAHKARSTETAVAAKRRTCTAPAPAQRPGRCNVRPVKAIST